MLFLEAGNLAPRSVELVTVFAAGQILRARLDLVAESERQALRRRSGDAALDLLCRVRETTTTIDHRADDD
jgi:hypothetical protein